MRRRQTVAQQWLIVRGAEDQDAIAAAMRLPRGTGILLLEPLARADMLRLRLRPRGSTIVIEPSRAAARVHDIRELRRALLARTPLILLSPIYPTASHPGWTPMPRLHAAALARLAGRRLVALGGMDARRFAQIRRLGFQAWAGISAFRI